MVHLEIDFEDLPDTYQLLEIDVPDDVPIERIPVATIEKMARDWRDDRKITRQLLLPWFEEVRTAVMAVPSVIMPFATNYLINPLHTDAARISVSHAARYPHDQRLFRRSG